MNLFPENPARTSVRGARGERGTALIEFALVFPMLLVLTLTVVDLSRAFFVKNMLEQAAREGVRTLVVTTLADSAKVRARVNQVAGAANISVKKLTITGPIDQQMGITVESEYSWMFPGLFNLVGAGFNGPVKLKGVAFMRKEGS
jgi:Flp pilus assembly protein TadG